LYIYPISVKTTLSVKAVSHCWRGVEFSASTWRGVELDPITLQSRRRVKSTRPRLFFRLRLLSVDLTPRQNLNPIPLDFLGDEFDVASEKPDVGRSSKNWTFDARRLLEWIYTHYLTLNILLCFKHITFWAVRAGKVHLVEVNLT